MLNSQNSATQISITLMAKNKIYTIRSKTRYTHNKKYSFTIHTHPHGHVWFGWVHILTIGYNLNEFKYKKKNFPKIINKCFHIFHKFINFTNLNFIRLLEQFNCMNSPVYMLLCSYTSFLEIYLLFTVFTFYQDKGNMLKR